jgi:hypothetical protein
MYTTVPSEDLWQGDIIRGIPYLVIGGATPYATVPKEGWSVKSSDKPFVILSHSCDVTKENKKRTKFLFSPLYPLKGETTAPDFPKDDPSRLNELKPGEGSFIDLFYFAPKLGILDDNAAGYYVNLTTMVQGKLDHTLLLGGKILELDEEHRRRLQRKIAYNFVRTA